eukprot:CAMPEP_0206454236 /NCGR_PEP_ID=MMETSP0324_2-20121206/21018_1 /ASSEMBLY_ACC=CAM_ASM_000836 /TAXON_ID=2866 /ORGANISM="Crypthecodinium cohnii, Strain Seligo" /LENGTH=35 /DNA_ID= /DNA_START= /DNA_END= /DNA_ORIENTATION=
MASSSLAPSGGNHSNERPRNHARRGVRLVAELQSG